MEETGLVVKKCRKGTFTNDFFEKENKHYVTLFMITDWVEGEPELKEPDKCESWQWFEWSGLPQPLFVPIENALKECFSPFDSKLV